MKKPAGKGSRSHLGPDDESVWDQTARTVEPLKRAKPRVRRSAEAEATDAPARSLKAEPPKVAAVCAKPKLAAAPLPPPPATKSTPPIADFDRKKARKIRSGQVEIEARIDLHGMRQNEAHAALAGFLRRCQGKGQRWVLVITGKGKAMPRDDDETFDMTRNHDRGVLKRNVPRWLDEPDVRPLVVSYTTAAPQHGGDGALYVHLRKR